MPQNLVYNNWKNFGPRLGFAYRALDGRKAFVIRGGYRISYYTEPISNWFNSQSAAQLVSANFVNSVSNTAVSPDGLPNYGLRSVPQYIAGVNTGNDIININDTRTLPRGFSAYFLDPHMQRSARAGLEPHDREGNHGQHGRARDLSGKPHQPTSCRRATSTTAHRLTSGTRCRSSPLPTGAFANVATRPYDQQVWGTVNEYTTTGIREFQRRATGGRAQIQAGPRVPGVLGAGEHA